LYLYFKMQIVELFYVDSYNLYFYLLLLILLIIMMNIVNSIATCYFTTLTLFYFHMAKKTRVQIGYVSNLFFPNWILKFERSFLSLQKCTNARYFTPYPLKPWVVIRTYYTSIVYKSKHSLPMTMAPNVHQTEALDRTIQYAGPSSLKSIAYVLILRACS
jgi:hypothetical protein